MNKLVKLSEYARVAPPRGDRYVAVSASMTSLMNRVERVAPLPWPVLITGESGVGKEGIAKALHSRSPRAPRTFVAVDAGAIPQDLIESELFGHERGSFTGAVTTHRGVFECAHGGTLFLDEVGELSLPAQARLLRIIETLEVRRVGSSSSRKVDVRLVCATNRDLRVMVEAGTFRADLYHRLACIVLTVPPLRERLEDLLELIEHFLMQISADLGRTMLSEGARIRLAAHTFPGNVRELRNVLCAAAAESVSGRIDTANIDTALGLLSTSSAPATFTPSSVEHAVQAAGGSLSAAARALGIPRSTLRDRLQAEARRASRIGGHVHVGELTHP